MLSKIKNYYFFSDPFHKSFYILVQALILILIAVFCWLYLQKPGGLYFLLTPLVTLLPTFIIYDLKGKIKGMTFGCIVLSCYVMIYYLLNDTTFLLLLSIFIFSLIALSFSIINPAYKLIALIAVAVSCFTSTQPVSWYIGVNSVINIYVMYVSAIIIEIIFSFKQHHFQKRLILSFLVLNIKRLEIIQNALKYNKGVDSEQAKKSLKNEQSIQMQAVMILNNEKNISKKNKNTELVSSPLFLKYSYQLRYTVIALLYAKNIEKINLKLNNNILKIVTCYKRALEQVYEFSYKQQKSLQILQEAQNLMDLSFGKNDIAQLSFDHQELAYYLKNLKNDIESISQYFISSQGN